MTLFWEFLVSLWFVKVGIRNSIIIKLFIENVETSFDRKNPLTGKLQGEVGLLLPLEWLLLSGHHCGQPHRERPDPGVAVPVGVLPVTQDRPQEEI